MTVVRRRLETAVRSIDVLSFVSRLASFGVRANLRCTVVCSGICDRLRRRDVSLRQTCNPSDDDAVARRASVVLRARACVRPFNFSLVLNLGGGPFNRPPFEPLLLSIFAESPDQMPSRMSDRPPPSCRAVPLSLLLNRQLCIFLPSAHLLQRLTIAVSCGRHLLPIVSLYAPM